MKKSKFYLACSTKEINSFLAYKNGNKILEVNESYHEIICPICKTIDEDVLLRRGKISLGKKLRKKIDFAETYDQFIVVSEHFKDIVENIDPVSLQFIELIDNPSFFIAYSNRPVIAEKGPYYIFDGDSCVKCNKPYNIIFSTKVDTRYLLDSINAVRLYSMRRLSLSLVFSEMLMNRFFDFGGSSIDIDFSGPLRDFDN